MLSFLNDGQDQAPAGQAENPQDQQDGTVCRQDDFLTVSGHGKKLRQSTMMLAVLFIAAAAVVLFMVKKTVPASAEAAPSQDQAQLEAALAQLNTMQMEVNTQMDSVVGKFYQFNNVEQVSVDELKRNPFKREQNGSSADGTPADDELKSLREKARLQAATMQIWSITSTARGKCCMINEKLLYTGDSINGMTVKEIDTKTVTLDYHGVLVQLKMSE
jgi:preprotein translocase subunit SecG